MALQLKEYEDYIIASFIIIKSLDVNNILEIEHYTTRFFNQSEYLEIEKFIKENELEKVKLMPANNENSTQFLEIFIIWTIDKKKYIVTVYDSLELTQDPQIIEIFENLAVQSL
jgi:hypothetical protein